MIATVTGPKDYYAILHVHPSAEREVIVAAYRALAKKYHPDIHADKELADRRIKELNEAYQVLSEPEQRRKYDELAARSATAPPRQAPPRPPAQAAHRRAPGAPAPAPSPPRQTTPEFLARHFAEAPLLREFARSLIGQGRADLADRLAAVVDRVGVRPEAERTVLANFCADAGLPVPWAGMTIEQMILAMADAGYQVDHDPERAIYRVARKDWSVFKDKFLFSDDDFRAYALKVIGG